MGRRSGLAIGRRSGPGKRRIGVWCRGLSYWLERCWLLPSARFRRCGVAIIDAAGQPRRRLEFVALGELLGFFDLPGLLAATLPVVLQDERDLVTLVERTD